MQPPDQFKKSVVQVENEAMGQKLRDRSGVFVFLFLFLEREGAQVSKGRERKRENPRDRKSTRLNSSH